MKKSMFFLALISAFLISSPSFAEEIKRLSLDDASAIGLKIEAEAPTGRSQIELQEAGPQADGLALDVRAAEVPDLVQDPGDPGPKAGGQVLSREGLGGRDRGGGDRDGKGHRSDGGHVEAASHGHLPDRRRSTAPHRIRAKDTTYSSRRERSLLFTARPTRTP